MGNPIRRWLPRAERELQDVRREHQLIDSPEEYERALTVCEGRIARHLNICRVQGLRAVDLMHQAAIGQNVHGQLRPEVPHQTFCMIARRVGFGHLCTAAGPQPGQQGG